VQKNSHIAVLLSMRKNAIQAPIFENRGLIIGEKKDKM
jgi:hypothetical protein